MREAAERDALRALFSRPGLADQLRLECGDGTILDLAAPCVVLGGRNGAGKTRLLRECKTKLGEAAIYVDLHVLTDLTLAALSARTDSTEMADDYEPLVLSGDRLSDVERVVGRDYEQVEWFALDMDLPSLGSSQPLVWGATESEPAVPFFRVTYRGASYGSVDMGLGEYSVHLLFWILEQLRERQGLLLLLDEPDAFLPPVGASALLARLGRICVSRNWRLLIASHSEELIRIASQHSAFVLTELGSDGTPSVSHSKDDPLIAREVMAPAPVANIIYCEDEVAHHLISAALREHGPEVLAESQVIWGNGSAYIDSLRKHLPGAATERVRHSFVYDGDQVGRASSGGRKAVFLPGGTSPDVLLRELRLQPEILADHLGCELAQLKRALDRLEGRDAHDWVDELGRTFGRSRSLAALATMWVKGNETPARAFVADLLAALRP